MAPLLLFGEPDSSLRGMVHDISGTAISGASVILRKSVSREEMGRIQTGPSGTFLFPLLPEGEYAMQVQAVGFMTVALEPFRLAAKEQKVLPPMTLQTGYGCGDPVLRRLTLLDPAEADRGTLSGVVEDPKERPVPGARVSLLCPGQALCGNTTSDAEGRFTFPTVEPGKYTVRIQTHGFHLDERQPYVVEAGYDAGYWPVLLERCHGRDCENRTGRKKNCE